MKNLCLFVVCRNKLNKINLISASHQYINVVLVKLSFLCQFTVAMSFCIIHGFTNRFYIKVTLEGAYIDDPHLGIQIKWHDTAPHYHLEDSICHTVEPL